MDVGYGEDNALTKEYDPEMKHKSSVTMLNRENTERLLMVNRYNQLGFRLNNEIFVYGPMILFPRNVFEWRVQSLETLTVDAFTLLFLMEPRIDVLVIGAGKRGPPKPELSRELHRELVRRGGFGVEVLPTDDALGVYNVLADEQRHVAGAFLPPSEVRQFEGNLVNAGEKINAGIWSGRLQPSSPHRVQLRDRDIEEN